MSLAVFPTGITEITEITEIAKRVPVEPQVDKDLQRECDPETSSPIQP